MSANRKIIFQKQKKQETRAVVDIPIKMIQSSEWHPRKIYYKSGLEELADSIREHGVIYPILVTKISGYEYRVVSGERRLRAAELAGLTTIPATVLYMNEKESAVYSIMENIQRENINFFNEAQAYYNLIYHLGYDLDKLAMSLGRSQSYVINKIKVLGLGEEIQDIIVKNKLTEKHANVLLQVPSIEHQKTVLRLVIEKGLNSRKMDELVKKLIQKKYDIDSLENETKSNTPDEKQPVKINRCLFKGDIKDVRVIENTIRKTVDIMRKQGVYPTTARMENDDCLEYVIRIAKH